MKYTVDTTYIVGNSKSQQNNPITHVYGAFFMGFIVKSTTGEIVDVECNSILPLTSDFIKTIFIGKNITQDYEKIRIDLEKRYLASSQKAILVAFKDAQKKFVDFKEGREVRL